MIEILKKGVLTGIGIGLMTKSKVEDFAKKAAEDAKLSEEEGRKFVEELLDQSCEARQQFEEKVHEKVQQTLESMDVATKEDTKALEKRLKALEKALAASKK